MSVRKKRSKTSSKKKQVSKKITTKKAPATKKTPAKRKNSNSVLKWSVPGDAKSTLFFKGPRNQVYFRLSPSTDGNHAVDALIGDDVTEDDILDIEAFDTVLLSTESKRRFVHVLLLNFSGQDIEVDVAFMFIGTSQEISTKYTFKVKADDSFSTSIPVSIVGA